jgi:hypothetical protein
MLGRSLIILIGGCSAVLAGANSIRNVSSITQPITGANPTESVSSTTELPKVSHQPVSQLVGMASIGFEVADASLQPPQAIEILSAGNQEDKFGDFTRVESIPDRWITIGGIKYDLGKNTKFDEGVGTDANILMYKGSSNNEYVLQVDGKLIHITNANNTNSSSSGNDDYIGEEDFKIYDSQTDLADFIAFAESMGIDEHTVLGAKIVLKIIMSIMGHGINGLDKGFMDPQADYLAFINQTVSPVLTETKSELKQKLEALKQCVRDGGDGCRPTTSAPNSSATTTQILEVSGAIRACEFLRKIIEKTGNVHECIPVYCDPKLDERPCSDTSTTSSAQEVSKAGREAHPVVGLAGWALLGIASN